MNFGRIYILVMLNEQFKKMKWKLASCNIFKFENWTPKRGFYLLHICPLRPRGGYPPLPYSTRYGDDDLSHHAYHSRITVFILHIIVMKANNSYDGYGYHNRTYQPYLHLLLAPQDTACRQSLLWPYLTASITTVLPSLPTQKWRHNENCVERCE